jgi:DNA-binding MarR family transcriptional regulator
MRTVSQRPLKTRSLRLDSIRAEDVIAYLLKSLHHSLRQVMDEALRRQRIDMSFAHFVTLYTLEAEPGVAGAELARRGFVTAQTMNTTLRRLEKDGDIERRPHPVNMRADSWYVTKAGQSKLDRAKVVGAAVWTRMLAALKAGEVAQLQNLLERCITGLDEQLGEMRSSKSVSRSVPGNVQSAAGSRKAAGKASVRKVSVKSRAKSARTRK